jgi:hypothetical protein
MKYLIFIALFFVLFGCDKANDEPVNHVEATPTPTKSGLGETPDYLNKPLRGKVGRVGLYRLVRSGGIINDASTSTGKSVSRPVVEQINNAQRIPLIRGAQMYLQYRIWPLPERPAYVDLRRVLKHPEMTLPDGRVATGSDFMIKARNSVNQAIGFTGYGLDEEYELVEGEWVFEIWYGDRKMVEQKFITYWPDSEEIARLRPLLELGNNVMGQSGAAKKPYARKNWPRITLGNL